ncbi:MAG: peptide ABC transporter permease [Gallionellales bacterium 35-53-114]|jgi:peptide/nickel transport system permease protein|nr:MAG: peptide ABC transporter permease [Gallionellales bacterium 35-53-114]OYZ64757.1 MAG: peptide ABC transporter permease [Gallionellales bacterium 24-53-125]OZB07704.1 MAG: peptide ABC transporter permease [Gallionellales bacterium 39-52-133]HQS58596.1 ABC transporter permease [Gallionellaceae bacterium]HQS74937.1 ABC transporter permease [Gallionellaceae bacterium]
MNFKLVLLWTDAMIFLLLAVALAGAWLIRQRPHLLLPWQRLFRSRIGMVSLLVLSLFIVVGLLDSMHYRVALPDKNGNGQTVYAAEVLSVFDTLVGDLRSQNEKTYSAPMAVYLYAKESMETADGKILREYPRLKYGGAHLQDPQNEHTGDVLKRSLYGLFAGWLGGVLLALLVVSVAAARSRTTARQWVEARQHTPLNAVLASVILLAMLFGLTANLAGAYHVLGTDKVGQDVLYLSLKSIRTGLVIGTVTTLVMLPFALFLGIAAGYFRGWVDDVIQYIYTVLSSIPSVLLIAAAVLMMQVTIEKHGEWFSSSVERADLRLLFLCLILGVTSWTGLCRLLRGEALKLRELEYIQAAQSFGVSSMRILSRHILPNVMHIVLIAVVMDFSALVLAEAVLSYVGVGVDPSTNSFGTLINNARLEMGREPMVWWTLAAAFSFMLVLVLAANLFADAVRDAFDPRLNRTGDAK